MLANQYQQERAVSESASLAGGNNGLQPAISPSQINKKLHKPAPSAASSAAVMGDASGESPVYNDTTTTLIDNTLYDGQQQPVTSSSVDDTDDDVNDLTVIDNDLYERQGQGQRKPGSDADWKYIHWSTAIYVYSITRAPFLVCE